MRTLPVFVSSTFRDFHWERDVLRRRVAPDLNARLAAASLSVTFVDLRWGVDTESLESEAEKAAKVLDVCFSEIDRCAPLFLGLLGQRAGWAPSPAFVDYLAANLGVDAGSIRRVLGDQPSLTALEFWRGALSTESGSVIVERTIDGGPTRDESDRLRAEIRRRAERGVLRLVPFSRPQDPSVGDVDRFAELVTAALYATTVELWDDRFGGQRAARHARHDPTFASGGDVFVGRGAELDRLGHLLEPDQPPGVVLAGSSGVGKSALLNALRLRLTESGRRCALASPGADGRPSTVRDVISDLALQLGLTVPDPPHPPASPTKALSEWWADQLAQLGSDLVILVDGLDQISTASSGDEFALIGDREAGPRLVVATSDDDHVGRLRHGGFSVVQLGPLPPGDVRAAAREWSITAESRELPTGALEAAARQARSGLWVRTAVNELSWLDQRDFVEAEMAQARSGISADAAIAQLVTDRCRDLPDGDDELVERTITRSTEHLGAAAGGWLTSLVLARHGITPHELAHVTGTSEVDSARARWILGTSLVSDDEGRLRFRHRLFERAARRRSAVAEEAGIHAALASLALEQDPAERLARDAALWHGLLSGSAVLVERAVRRLDAETDGWAHDLLVDVIIAGRHHGLRPVELLHEIADSGQLEPGSLLPGLVVGAMERGSARGLTGRERVQLALTNIKIAESAGEALRGEYLALQLAAAFRDAGDDASALRLFREAADMLGRHDLDTYLRIQVDICGIELRAGDLDAALATIERAASAIDTADVPVTTRVQVSIAHASTLLHRGDSDAALAILRGLLDRGVDAEQQRSIEGAIMLAQWEIDTGPGVSASLEAARWRVARTNSWQERINLANMLLEFAGRIDDPVAAADAVDEAEALTDQLIAESPDDVGSRQAMVRVQIARADLSLHDRDLASSLLADIENRLARPRTSTDSLNGKLLDLRAQFADAHEPPAVAADAATRLVEHHRAVVARTPSHIERIGLYLALSRSAEASRRAGRPDEVQERVAEAVQTAIAPDLLAASFDPVVRLLQLLSSTKPDASAPMTARAAWGRSAIIVSDLIPIGDQRLGAVREGLRATGRSELATAAVARDDHSDALEHLGDAIPAFTGLVAQDIDRWGQDLSAAMHLQIRCLRADGDVGVLRAAVASFVEHTAELSERDPASRVYLRTRLIALLEMSNLEQRMPSSSGAAAATRRAACELGRAGRASGVLDVRDDSLLAALCGNS